MLDCSRVYKKDKIILHFAIEKCLEKAEYKLTFNLEDEYFKTKEGFRIILVNFYSKIYQPIF